MKTYKFKKFKKYSAPFKKYKATKSVCRKTEMIALNTGGFWASLLNTTVTITTFDNMASTINNNAQRIIRLNAGNVTPLFKDITDRWYANGASFERALNTPGFIETDGVNNPIFTGQTVVPLVQHNNDPLDYVLSLGRTPIVRSYKVKCQMHCTFAVLDVTNDGEKRLLLFTHMLHSYAQVMRALFTQLNLENETFSWDFDSTMLSNDQVPTNQRNFPRIPDSTNEINNMRDAIPLGPTVAPGTLSRNPNIMFDIWTRLRDNYTEFKSECTKVFGSTITFHSGEFKMKFNKGSERKLFPVIIPDSKQLLPDLLSGWKYAQFVTTYSQEGIGPELALHRAKKEPMIYAYKSRGYPRKRLRFKRKSYKKAFKRSYKPAPRFKRYSKYKPYSYTARGFNNFKRPRYQSQRYRSYY